VFVCFFSSFKKKLMQEQEQQQPIKAESTAPNSSSSSSSYSNGRGNQIGISLPALAVAAANACNSPTFTGIKPPGPPGGIAKGKKPPHPSPITVPKRAIGEFRRSPTSGSPTPTDFSPMLLPRAEENLISLISEHNKQQRQLQLQQQLQQQQQAQLQLQQQQFQQQQQQLKRSFEVRTVDDPLTSSSSSAEQPPLKRTKLSKRGRKRQHEPVPPNGLSGAGSQQLTTTVSGMGTRTAQRRSSLGSVSVSIDAETTVVVSGAGGPGPAVMRKGPWLPDEDSKLLELVEQYGAYDWSFIADHIPGRVGKQCRERYFNHLAPDVRKEAWTDREDDAIVHAHHVVGNKWTNIAKMLGNGRSPNSIKNRWHSSLKNRLGERGGEASVMEATGAASGCHCDCRRCDCSCKVACVAFGCQCCFAAHNSNSNTSPTETADDGQTVSAHTATDDETTGSTSSSVSTTPASASSSVAGPTLFSAPGPSPTPTSA